MNIQILFDLIMIILLGVTIGFASVLNHKLNIIKKSKKELINLINDFNIATSRAETSIPKFKQTIEANSLALKEQTEKAQVLRDDLSFMIERSEAIAERLESDLKIARHEAYNKPKNMNKPSVSAFDIVEEPKKKEEPPRAAKREGAKTMLGAMALNDLDDEEAFFGKQENMSEAERKLLKAMQSSSLKG